MFGTFLSLRWNVPFFHRIIDCFRIKSNKFQKFCVNLQSVALCELFCLIINSFTKL